MPQPGIRSDGFFVPHFLFGGILSPGGFNVQNYPSSSFLSSDCLAKSVTVSGTLNTFRTSDYGCYKIIALDTFRLNSGAILCDGISLHGGGSWPSQTGAFGFSGLGSLGGSGAGGDAQTSNGSPGSPPAVVGVPGICLGGGGGGGGTHGSDAGGAGGGGVPSTINNVFQPSIWQSASIWATPSTVAQDPLAYTNLPGLMSVPFWGGGGGGGCADKSGSSGGGACGGGVIYIAADRIVLNGGTINASGQSAISTAGGGGGGGGGGVIVLVCNELVWQDPTTVVTAAGGSGGGSSAINGLDGKILVFNNQLVCSFTGTMTHVAYMKALLNYRLKGLVSY